VGVCSTFVGRIADPGGCATDERSFSLGQPTPDMDNQLDVARPSSDSARSNHWATYHASRRRYPGVFFHFLRLGMAGLQIASKCYTDRKSRVTAPAFRKSTRHSVIIRTCGTPVQIRLCGKRPADAGQIVGRSEGTGRAMKVGLPSIEERRGPRRACFPEIPFHPQDCEDGYVRGSVRAEESLSQNATTRIKYCQ